MAWEPTLPVDPVKKAVKVEGVAGGTPVPVSGSLSATTTAHATAAAPSLVEGSDNNLSTDLAGNLRTLATATTAATATAADPAYAEGSTSPISQDRTGHLRTTGLTDTQLRANAVPVSAASLPLPSGAATGAKQDTGNTSLASIDTKLTNPLPVSGTVTANQGGAPWSMRVREDTSLTLVDPADATNKAIRVNVVASSGSTTFSGTTDTGTGDGATTTFSLAHIPTDTPRVFVDRIRQVQGTDYTISGAVITWIVIPGSGAPIQVDYTWSLTSATLASAMTVDAKGNVQPTGDVAGRSIHVTADNLPPLVSAKDPVDLRGLALAVNVAQVPLAQHAATDTLQGVGNTSLASIAANTPLVSGRRPVDGSGVTQPVSASALPLPSGASAETTQAQVRNLQERALLQAMDVEIAALASRGRERFTLSISRGGR